MKKLEAIAALAVAAAVALGGCSAEADTADAAKESAATAVTPEPVPTVEKDAAYSTVGDLRDAVELAGLECTDYAVRAKSAIAAEQADCTAGAVLLIFASTDPRDAQVATLKSISIDDDGQPLLVGANWVINADVADLETLQPVLGGIIDRSMPIAAEPAPESFSDRDIQVLALKMTIEDSGDKASLCETYVQLGAEITAGAINASVNPGEEFPADVVAEAFDATC